MSWTCPEKLVEQLVGHAPVQGTDGELPIVGLPAPAVLILRPVGHDEENAGGGQALHERVENGLRLGIDPVQVLYHQTQRPTPALPDEEPSNGFEGAAPTLLRVEPLPRGIVDVDIEQGEERGKHGEKRWVEVEESRGHPFPYGARVIPFLDVEVASEEGDHGPVGRARVERSGEGLEDPPLVREMAGRELSREAGLAHARLAHERHDLAVTISSVLHRRGKIL
jgi:hypothetical protein